MLLAEPISHTSTQYIDYVEISNISLDLSTIYFTHFSGCWASFVYTCHSIPECCHVFWSQVEYKIVCVLFIILHQMAQHFLKDRATIPVKWLTSIIKSHSRLTSFTNNSQVAQFNVEVKPRNIV